MLKEKVAKMMKLAAAGMMLALGVAAAAPTATVQADMLAESEPNDNPATATQLPLNEWLRGEIETDGEQDWYYIDIPSYGVCQIQTVPTEDIRADDAKWYLYVYDVNRRELMSRYGSRLSTYKVGLVPGKYYIKIKQSYRYSNGITYNLRANFETSDSWEHERYYGDESLLNATDIVANKTYTGIMYCGDDKDYYRLKLNGTNKISLKFLIDDTVSDPGRWYIEFIEYDTRKSLGGSSLSTNETLNVSKCTGDLIIRISNSYGATGQLYHFLTTTDSLVTATPTPIQTVAPTQAPTPSNTNTTIVKPSATRITSIKPGKKQATIRWKKASNATGYYVYRSTKAKGGYKKIATVNGKTTYKDKKALKSKKTYYYKVISYRKNGSKVLKSRASGYKKVKVK